MKNFLILMLSLISITAFGRETSARLIGDIGEGAVINIRQPISFAEGQELKYFLKARGGFWNSIFGEDLNAEPVENDSYCLLERQPGRTQAEVVNDVKFQIVSIHESFESNTGAFQGTRFRIKQLVKDQSGNYQLQEGPIRNIECLGQIRIAELDVPSVSGGNGENYTDMQLDGDRLSLSDFEEIFRETLALEPGQNAVADR